MFVPLFLFLLSLAGIAASVLAFGPSLGAPHLLSLICAFASAILVLSKVLRPVPNYIVIDGSNVLHWKNEKPSIETVRHVLIELSQQGFVPLVWFDANVGYKIGTRYLGPAPLSGLLGIPARHVFVAPKGTPADPLLLDDAIALAAKVVTNDQFRDWTERFPQVKEPGFLVSGRMRGGAVALDFAF